MNQNPQSQQQPQQPQYQQPQYQQPQQQYQQPVYYQRPPMDKGKLFGIIVTSLFGAAAVFALVALIGFCASKAMPSNALVIVAEIFAILGCAGMAVAPFIKGIGKLITAVSGLVILFGGIGLSLSLYTFSSMIGSGSGFGGSFGYFLVLLGYISFAFVCWLYYTNNKIVKYLCFVPGGLILIGSIINWIVMKYFSVCIKNATVFFLFDFLGTLFFVGATVLFGLYIMIKLGGAQRQRPVYAQPQQPQYQQPQQPYQGQ